MTAPIDTGANDDGASAWSADGGCEDTREDPGNCGYCGHTCLEGDRCQDRVCQARIDGSSAVDAADSMASTTCLGSVVFQLLPPSSGTARYCENLNGSFQDWLSVSQGSGPSLAISHGCEFVTCMNCDTLPFNTCGAIAPPMAVPLPVGGEQSSWDGTTWAIEGQCAGVMNNGVNCSRAHCAPAGRYTAHMCAFPAEPTDGEVCVVVSPSSPPICVDVPFEYPGQTLVTGTLP